jgi:hypothetical protein
MPEPKPAQRESAQADGDRRIANMILLAFIAAAVGGGLWLINSMIDQRALDDCAAQGRRNCVPVGVPGR